MMHALAYRGGLGKVVLCNTSVKAAGLGKWTYVSGSEPRLSSGCQFQVFEKLVVKLTQCQHTPDWFALRKFRITGLVAIELLRSLAKHGGSSRNDENDANLEKYYDLAGHTSVQLLLKLLSIPINGQSSNREPAPNQLSRTVLDKTKNKEFQQPCRARGIATSGNKREMIDRLLSPETANLRRGKATRSKSPEASLLAAWFMTPKPSTDMKIGSKNEVNICLRVISFIERYSCFRIVEMRSHGLLCRKGTTI
ncbi:hypothetical protein PF007_g17684 [Phytophthora fragariae]|uniref:SAP domain-containing protein n=1 Tax=Phytophthora fragariae TaxID=53985 RepID=A0A6A3RE64_9STRA|nr:hypothetical protein PF007_g17684 [Phytophthora fragariae]